ncbi:hypothetical protein [Streptomyces longisporus]|uniref:Uncharacterized protein n=1 Tax=Streptomyces longisporus TaxID=1948 RepID=A0ABN3L9I1_STRLO
MVPISGGRGTRRSRRSAPSPIAATGARGEGDEARRAVDEPGFWLWPDVCANVLPARSSSRRSALEGLRLPYDRVRVTFAYGRRREADVLRHARDAHLVLGDRA